MDGSWICADASVVLRLVLGGDEARSIARRWVAWRDGGGSVVAPTLLPYEVANALHRYVIAGALEVDDAERALDASLDLLTHLVGDAALHRRAVALARTLDLAAAYDAHYVALAERLGATLWTLDARLAGSVRRAGSLVPVLDPGHEDRE